MNVSQPLVDFVKRWEKCVLTLYYDYGGVPTAGWGHSYPEDTPWTQERADAELTDDLQTHGDELRLHMLRAPTQRQYDALTSLAYNCGVHAIGHSGLMQRYNVGDDSAVYARFLLWNRVKGVVVPGLTKRRHAERRIFMFGDYSGKP